MRWRNILLAGFGLVLGATAARANDSTAELAAGGLVLTTNAHIAMRAEDLYISTAEIRVRYVFFNAAAQDITTLVAFPMPDVDKSDMESDISIPTENPENLLDFSVKADGVAISPRLEQKVFVKGTEHTALLRKLGIPLAPHLAKTREALDLLSEAAQQELLRLELVGVNEYDVGKGMEKHIEPRWRLKSTYFWQQTFPAGREIIVEHRYKPAVGASAGTIIGSPGWSTAEATADYRAKYCIDADFLATVERVRKAAKVEYPPFTEERIAYILKTGANWAGPIEDFHLVVDKGSPDKIVSFCGNGVRKISPTAFEMRAKNFVPASDFYVLLLTKLPAN